MAGVRRFVLTLLSALLVGCGGGSDSGADTAAPQAVPLQEQTLVFTQAGPLNLVVGDTLSNVASGGLGTGVISYRSSDTTIATVDATGRLTVVGAGIATITAEKAADAQYAAASAGYDVSARPAPQDPGPEPQRIGFDQPGPFNLVVGDTLSNVASGGPGTGVISYSSSNTTVATVDAAGQLTVVGAGIATITAEKAADAKYMAASASYLVQTTPASQAIGFDQAGPLYLMVGDTLSNVASGGSGTGVIRYSSSNTTVATVDAAGELTVVGIGTAEITAEKAADANYTAASASYTVNAPSRVSMTAWVGREDAEVQVDLPLWASDMPFFRSTEANCDVSNVHSCANGQWNRVTGGETVTDTAFTLNQTAYYVLQHGANQASLEVSTERFSPRNAHQVVAHNNRLWVIGGDDGVVKNDVWWSADGVTWTEVPPEARARDSEHFSARDGHQVVSFDDKLWLIGGWDGTDSYDDVWWSADGVTWTKVPPEARRSEHFSARRNHQVVVHNDELWLIGGRDGSARNNDVWWSANGVTWTEVPPEARARDSEHFSAREGHQVVSFDDKLWVIGGLDGAFFLKSDVWWSEDGVTWTEATNNAEFSPRNAHQVVAHNDRLWLIGGFGAANYNDVWWSEGGVTWTEGTRFSGRFDHHVVVHNNRLWLIGGYDGAFKNDVWWSADGARWHKVEKAPGSDKLFSERSNHQVAVYDDKLWVIGGRYHEDSYNDVWWSVDGKDWTKVDQPTDSDKLFSERSRHQVAVYDDKLWVIGGWCCRRRYNDVWWSVDGKDWTPVDPPTDSDKLFSKRSNHQVAVYDDKLWVIGGNTDDGRKNDVWWSEDGKDWTKVDQPTDSDKLFSERSDHQVAVYDDKLWVIGGWGGGLNDVWWSEDNGKTWTEATNSAEFSLRDKHQVVVHNNRLWVIGGWDGSAHKNDVWWSKDGVNWRLGFHRVFQFQ